jgi:hypothetical protein
MSLTFFPAFHCFLSTLFFAIPLPCESKFPSFAKASSIFVFYTSIPALISDERFLHHTTPPFGISLTRSLLNLYTSRTCINIMLLLNLSCVFTRTPRCGCRHSCRLGLMCNPSLYVESTYRGDKQGNWMRKCYAYRTAVFAAVSEWNKPGKKSGQKERSERRQTNSLSNISRMK